MVTVLAPSATSISSPSPSRSMHSTVVPVPSSTHPTRRPFRPFSATDILPSLHPFSTRHRLIAIFVLANYTKTISLRIQCVHMGALHLRSSTVPMRSASNLHGQGLLRIPSFYILHRYNSPLLYSTVLHAINQLQDAVCQIFALTFSLPKPVNNYDTFIVEKVSIQKLQINLAFFSTFPT